MFPKITVGKIITFVVLFAISALGLRFLPENMKQWFRI